MLNPVQHSPHDAYPNEEMRRNCILLKRLSAMHAARRISRCTVRHMLSGKVIGKIY